MNHEATLQLGPERHALLMKGAFWGAVAGALAMGLAYSVLSNASMAQDCVRSPRHPAECAATRTDAFYFPSQFKAPEGEASQPIATF